MKVVLPTLLSLFPLLAWGTKFSPDSAFGKIPQMEGAIESRQGRCKITGNQDVECKLAPLVTHVVRTIPPGTNIPVTCQMPGRPDEPYVYEQ